MQRGPNSKSLQELIDNYNAEIMRYSQMARQADNMLSDSAAVQREIGEQQRESGEEATERGKTERDYWLAKGKQGLQYRSDGHMARPEANEPIYRPGSHMPRPEPYEPLETPAIQNMQRLESESNSQKMSGEYELWMREVEKSLTELRQSIDLLRENNGGLRQTAPAMMPESNAQAPVEPIAPDDRKAQSESSVQADEAGVGYLQVGVYTARQSNPVPNARVTVFRETDSGRELYASAVTNDDGKIPLLQMPVGKSSSDEINAPFAIYDVSVAAEGYYPRNQLKAQIFDGITALLWVEITPLPDSAWNEL